MPTPRRFLYQAKDLFLLFQGSAPTIAWCQKEVRLIRQKYGLKRNAPIPWRYVAEHFGYDLDLVYQLIGHPDQ